MPHLNPPPVDAHLHLLPGVDDGPLSVSEVEQMLAQFAARGYKRLAATPHLMGALTSKYLETVQRAMEQVRPLTQGFGINVVTGFEVMLTPDVPDRLARGEPISLAGTSYVLVELPFGFWPEHSAATIFEVQAAGFRPVLAHPERYLAAQQNPHLVLELADRDVVVQVTYASLTGINGRTCKALAERLVIECPHVILATDAHSNGTRLHAIDGGLVSAIKLAGPARTAQMAALNPAAILNHEPLPEQLAIEPAAEQLSLFGRIRKGVAGN